MPGSFLSCGWATIAHQRADVVKLSARAASSKHASGFFEQVSKLHMSNELGAPHTHGTKACEKRSCWDLLGIPAVSLRDSAAHRPPDIYGIVARTISLQSSSQQSMRVELFLLLANLGHAPGPSLKKLCRWRPSCSHRCASGELCKLCASALWEENRCQGSLRAVVGRHLLLILLSVCISPCFADGIFRLGLLVCLVQKHFFARVSDVVNWSVSDVLLPLQPHPTI